MTAAALFPKVVVNGATVPGTEIAAEAQHHSAPPGKPGLAWRKAASAVAIRTLLLQEAARCGVPCDPRSLGPGRVESREEAMVRKLLEMQVEGGPVSEAEIRAHWARDPSRFRAPPLWEVSHILIACDPSDGPRRASALARAADVCTRAHGNPQRFAALARDWSDCPSASQGGLLGQIGPGDCLPVFEAELRRLSVGDITAEPVLTEHGFHIIRLEAQARGDILPYEVVRPKIRAAMERAAWVLAARIFLSDLVCAAKIEGAEMAGYAPAGL